jgi:transcriptional regulator GlxA family with amidase domain
MMASACSGAVLLGEAGLLDGCEATIHWGYVKTLTNNYPSVSVRQDRSLVMAGTAQRIVMAGGGTSWQDLALYLIGRFVGLREAIEVARVYILQWHDLGQQPFAALMSLRQSEDTVINRCQEWVGEHYCTAGAVAGMLANSGLSERTFFRRFRKATGLTPIDYLHAVRIEEAKQLLETTDTPVEAVANEIGYEDTSFFTRLFRRKVGLSPMQYRRQFGRLRKVLGEHPAGVT